MIREVKRLGGFDSVGTVYGDDISPRVEAELTAIIGRARAQEIMADDLYYNDCNHPWWTSISSYETEADQQDRIREFISFVRYSDATTPVFVGHSLFFRAFYSKRVSNMLSKNRPDLAANMRKFRLSNATLLAVTLHFLDLPNGNTDATILDADLIFGGGFHGGTIQDDDDDDDDDDDTGSNPIGMPVPTSFRANPLEWTANLVGSASSDKDKGLTSRLTSMTKKFVSNLSSK